MPQMSPFNWFFVLILALSMLFMLNSKIFFEMPIKFNSPSSPLASPYKNYIAKITWSW